jgi:hypothetical protein
MQHKDTAPDHQQDDGEPPQHAAGSSGGVEANPGLIGQASESLGPQHGREGAQHAWQPPGRHHRHTVHDHLAPGDLGAMDRHDRHHHHVGIGQRTRATWSASNDTARTAGARG